MGLRLYIHHHFLGLNDLHAIDPGASGAVEVTESLTKKLTYSDTVLDYDLAVRGENPANDTASAGFLAELLDGDDEAPDLSALLSDDVDYYRLLDPSGTQVFDLRAGDDTTLDKMIIDGDNAIFGELESIFAPALTTARTLGLTVDNDTRIWFEYDDSADVYYLSANSLYDLYEALDGVTPHLVIDGNNQALETVEISSFGQIGDFTLPGSMEFNLADGVLRYVFSQDDPSQFINIKLKNTTATSVIIDFDGDFTFVGGVLDDEIRLEQDEFYDIDGRSGTDTVYLNFAAGPQGSGGINDLFDFEVLSLDDVRLLDASDGAHIATLRDVEYLKLGSETLAMSDITGAIEGTHWKNRLVGTDGDDIIDADLGDDIIAPKGGSDTIFGGAGRDILVYSDLADAPGREDGEYRLHIDMEAGTVTGDGVDTTFDSIERVTGSEFKDLIRGSSDDDMIRGWGGKDWIIATEGEDTYRGGEGRDMLSYLEWTAAEDSHIDAVLGETGAPPDGGLIAGVQVDLDDGSNNTGLAEGHKLLSIERITGTSYQDVFWGNEGNNDFRGMGGNDWFVGSGGGRDRYLGGAGIDTVTYFNANSGVTAHLSSGALKDGQETGTGRRGLADNDRFISIENLIGSGRSDRLHGSSADNQLNGLEGDDFLFGLAGDDTLRGGGGDNLLKGGTGSDTAVFDGDLADFDLTRVENKKVVITHDSGTDTAINVEYFQFDDQTVDVWSL